MIHDTVLSPMGNYGDTLFDKLNNLGSELWEGIVRISGGKRWLVEVELQRLKEEAQKDSSPEAVLAILLFRKYSEIAKQIKEDNTELKEAAFTILPESGNDERLLQGYDALKSNLFWLRVLAAIFSFITFAVMSNVPYMSHADYHPSNYFHSSCDSIAAVGYFNMRPYYAVIVSAVSIYIHTLVTSMYYLLPVDENNQKYIPGLLRFMTVCLDNEQEAIAIVGSMSNCVRTTSRLIEVVVDLCLVLLSFVSFVVAAVTVDTPVMFQQVGGDTAPHEAYYSLPAFYQTFSSADCMREENPAPKIRASLAMMFFAMCVMIICLQVSWRNASKEVTHRSAPRGGRNSADIATRGIHTDDGREAFLAAPLPTSSQHSGGDGKYSIGGDSDSDEEVSVTFPHSPHPDPKITSNNNSNITSKHSSHTTSAALENVVGEKATTSVTNDSRGVGRGAALMRRYEGNNLRKAAEQRGASTPSHETDDVVAETGSHAESKENQGKRQKEKEKITEEEEVGRVEEGYGTLPQQQYLEETDL